MQVVTLEQRNAALLSASVAYVENLLAMCEHGPVVGDANQKTAFIHANFQRQWEGWNAVASV